MNTRRHALIALGAAAVSSRLALAQTKQPILIGWLSTNSLESDARSLSVLKEALAALGWKEGSQIVFDDRWADGRADRLPSLANDLAARRPAIIVVQGLRAAVDGAKGAPQIPIVMTAGGDPVAAGLAASLARPGGMVTGVTANTGDLTEKYLELLLAAVPTLRRVGFLGYSRNANRVAILETVRRSVTQHSVKAHFAEAATPDEIEPAMSRLAKEGVQALIVLPGSLLLTERRRISRLALSQRWPAVASFNEFAEEGTLLTYGVDRFANYRRAAYYVDRILKGAKPGDLPIEQPTKFELIVNMKTAKALGLTIPQSFLMRADRVIE